MAMSNNDFDQLSDINFLKLIRNIYENNIPNVDLDKKREITTEIFKRLDSFDTNAINLCLKLFCLLIKDCDGIDTLIDSSILEILQKLSGLDCKNSISDIRNAIEAEKCMCNLIYMSSTVQKYYSTSGVVDAITQRIKERTEIELNDDIRFYDMRMLFLLTTFNSELRQRVQENFHGLSYLFEIINQIILFKSELNLSIDSGINLSNSDIDYLIEILKTLYNLTIDIPNLIQTSGLNEEEEAHLMRLVSILRELLLCSGPTNDKQIALQIHVVNLLNNMPKTCYEELLSPIEPDDENENDGKNLDAINKILQFLDYQLKKININKNAQENLFPVLQLLISICQSNRIIRQFTRQLILPSNNEQILGTPMEGQTLHDKLICLMRKSNSQLKFFSTKLLFILCKENVNRLRKYSGIENTAELLDELNLINIDDNSNKDQYSSDSDEFEIDNYRSIDEQCTDKMGQLQIGDANFSSK